MQFPGSQVATVDMPPSAAIALGKAGIDGILLGPQQLKNRVAYSLPYWRVAGLVAQEAITAPVKVSIENPDSNLTHYVGKRLREWAVTFAKAQELADTIGYAYVEIEAWEAVGTTVSDPLREHSSDQISLRLMDEKLKLENGYYVVPSLDKSVVQTIHHSRVLHFSPRQGGPAVQRFHNAWQVYRGALLTAVGAMLKKDVFVVEKKGLDQDVAAADDPDEYVFETLQTITKTLDQDGVLLLDARFTTQVVSRNLGDMPAIVEQARLFAIAQSGLTERLLFGYGQLADPAGNGEDPNAVFLSTAVDRLVNTHWIQKYQHLIDRYDLAQDVTLLPQASYQLSAAALATVQLEVMRAAAIADSITCLSREEIRSFWTGGSWTNHITEDPEYTPEPRELTPRPKNQDLSRIQPDDRVGLSAAAAAGDTPTPGSERPRLSDAIATPGMVEIAKRGLAIRTREMPMTGVVLAHKIINGEILSALDLEEIQRVTDSDEGVRILLSGGRPAKAFLKTELKPSDRPVSDQTIRDALKSFGYKSQPRLKTLVEIRDQSAQSGGHQNSAIELYLDQYRRN